MIAVPAKVPVTVPEITEAVAVLLLVHVPPVIDAVNTVLAPLHIVRVPVMVATGFTDTALVAVAEVPQASVAVTVYTVLVDGLTFTIEPVSPPGFHT
jgi:hypothetical protein